MVIEAYLDESGTHRGALISCSGGYLFERDQREAFDAAWRLMLADFEIPYFHMTSIECGEPPMDRLPSELRHALLRRAIGIIKETMTYGIVVAVHPKQFDAFMPDHPLIGSAYNFVTHQTIMAASVWAQEANYHGPISYFFESGAAHQEDANAFMHIGVQDEGLAKQWRYDGHAFKPKRTTPALQAADLLVWHYCDDWGRQSKGGYSRDSYVSLVDDRYWHFRWSKKLLQAEADKIRKLAALYPDAALPMPGATEP